MEQVGKRGRPSIYTEDLAEDICTRIGNGQPLSRICEDLGIERRTVQKWRKDNEDFNSRYTGAREAGFDAIAEDTLNIADDDSEDLISTPLGKQVNIAAVQRAKLKIDTRLRLLRCWDPKRYGEKVEIQADVNTTLTSSNEMLLSIAQQLNSTTQLTHAQPIQLQPTPLQLPSADQEPPTTQQHSIEQH